MRSAESWEPTTIIPSEAGWTANLAYIAPWSTHVTSLEYPAYSTIIERYASGDLLDVGAGTVPYYGIYKDKVENVVTIDWPNSLHELNHVDIYSNLNRGLPIKNESFDTILLGDVLEHINEPANLINECARVLKNSGNVMIFVPFLYGLHEEPNDHFRYTEHGLRHLISSAGLSVKELNIYGGGPDVVLDTVEIMIKNNPLLSKGFRILSPYVTSSNTYKNLRDKYSKVLPLGYTVVADKSRS